MRRASVGNFGLPGMMDLPTARSFPDGEIVITHQNHKYLLMTGLSFQALPQLGLSFRYGGQGRGGGFAQGRVNWDRSFDAHISLLSEGKYVPAISLGLRDFIGTGWYSSEYIVGTKSFENLEITAGLGFGRLAERNLISNPLGVFSSRFDQRDPESVGKGGTLGTINWFQGDAAIFFGIQYHVGDTMTLMSEYTSDLMSRESSYLQVKSPWNFGAAYHFNDYISLSAQYLHGSQVSVTAQASLNPNRAPLLGGKELAPVPMRLRNDSTQASDVNDERIIRKVLAVDGFEIQNLEINGDTANISVKNTKFRSVAQAVGRITSTLQRFTIDDVKFGYISFYSKNLKTATYRVNLEKVTTEQFYPVVSKEDSKSITAIDIDTAQLAKDKQRFQWGVGPYITHRLFNPDLPLSVEAGIEVEGNYQITQELNITASVRKSVLTNLTDNERRSNSILPRVHSRLATLRFRWAEWSHT